MSTIEKFMERVESATKARSKEIRLTLSEAQSLSLAMARILERDNKLLEKIVLLQEEQNQILKDQPSNDIVMDGGEFTKS